MVYSSALRSTPSLASADRSHMEVVEETGTTSLPLRNAASSVRKLHYLPEISASTTSKSVNVAECL
ncbi:unnamed protein product [Nippostrongylus brasiliensis]|uniref:Secreted protein n=1 Tax=Nippostrongylus brasiliensis TaxID=27835 RepID=A0A0N4XKZ5_NIPBR|nr:unnamed protein product [Nippostrongylus brasiliensis]